MPRFLLTADEAYPAFEEAVLSARDRVRISFRIFDPCTRLRSDAGRALGDTWLDLIVARLRDGIRFDIYIADFDPIMATELHQCCWSSIRELSKAHELAGEASKNLHVVPARHAAKVGLVPRIALAPGTRAKLKARAQWLDEVSGEDRARRLASVPGLQAALAMRNPIPRLYPASHHQKIAVVDDRLVYVGGLDLDERRFDTKDHDRPSQDTWHDVQVMIEDPTLAKSTAEHIDSFCDVVRAKRRPAPAPGLVRTMSRMRLTSGLWRMSPHTVVDEIYHLHRAEIAKARKQIYLETQYLRDRRLARAIVRRAREVPDLKVIVVLPGAPETVAFERKASLDARFGERLQVRCLTAMRKALGDRLLIASPVQPRAMTEADDASHRAHLHGAPLIYLHAKVSIFDGVRSIVSSANLNGRSMRWDTEAGISFDDTVITGTLRDRIFGLWLPDDVDPRAFSPDHGFDVWREVVMGNLMLPPSARRGFLVPYAIKPARRDGTPVPGVPEEMV